MTDSTTYKPGDRCGKYVIEDLLGQGGMGEVYRARQEFTGKEVAVKVLPVRHNGRSDFHERMGREARALARLDHPNIVTILDGGITDDNVVYIVMEYLKGKTMRDFCHQAGALPVATALGFGAQIADAMTALHAASMLHRDLKPENVFVLPGGRIKIIDFGLTKMRDHAARTTVKPESGGGIMGTVHYMPPEQLMNEGVDEKSDVYAIALILWEAIAGKHVFQLSTEEFPSPEVVTMNHYLATPRPLGEVVAGVPAELTQLLARALSKTKQERPTASEFADLLRGIGASLAGAERAKAAARTPDVAPSPRHVAPVAFSPSPAPTVASPAPAEARPKRAPVHLSTEPLRAGFVPPAWTPPAAAYSPSPSPPAAYSPSPASPVALRTNPMSVGLAVTEEAPKPRGASHSKPTPEPFVTSGIVEGRTSDARRYFVPIGIGLAIALPAAIGVILLSGRGHSDGSSSAGAASVVTPTASIATAAPPTAQDVPSASTTSSSAASASAASAASVAALPLAAPLAVPPNSVPASPRLAMPPKTPTTRAPAPPPTQAPAAPAPPAPASTLPKQIF